MINFNKNNKRLYNIWGNMKGRCYNKNNIAYKNYGNRGILVCNEWKNNFKNFEQWSIKNGYKENLTLDRIDNNGNYEPNNCRWVDIKTQSNNRRTNRIIEYNGKKQNISQWANELGIPIQVIFQRLKLNMPLWKVFYSGNLNYMKKKSIIQKDLEHNIVKIWDCSLKNIAKEKNYDIKKIKDCLEHKTKKYKGYIWRYKDDISD